jgi:hypothetical protein
MTPRLLAIALTMLGAAAAAAQIPVDKVSADIAQRYGVSVLKVTPTEIDGHAAYAVVVMNPGGDDNGAFKVSTLLVDAASGELLPQFAHRTAGYELPPAPDTATPGNDAGPILRSLTAREYRVR